jgi:FemAB-related protein (PEP-CTERM system-associated)
VPLLNKENVLTRGPIVNSTSCDVSGLVGSSPDEPYGGLTDSAIVVLSESEYTSWDAFVLEHEHGSPFHLTAWKKVIEETYGYQAIYLMAVRESRVTGVLPLFVVRNIVAGTILLSTPFAVYGGILATDVKSRDSLRERVTQLAHSLQVEYVELRNAYEEQCVGFSRISRYVTFSQELGNSEAKLTESIPRKTRYMVRKSLKEPFATVCRCDSDSSKAFEEIYSRNLRKLGTPCFPSRYFEKLLEHFKGMIDIREVKLGTETAAAVLSFYFRDRILPYYGASDPDYSNRAPNNFMYYDLMRWGMNNGYRVFDFGRSKKTGSGSYEFKAHWGMVERELPYEILLIRRKELPNYSPNNPAFDLPMKMWRRMPLCITRAIGPMLVRLFP